MFEVCICAKILRSDAIQTGDEKEMKKKKEDIFYRYFFTYFIVLFIPLAICSVYCVRMLHIIGKDDVQVYKAELAHSAALVENVLKEISDTGDLLVANPLVGAFQHKKDAYKYPDSYRINELQQDLPQTYEINQSIFDYFLFFNQSDMALNPYAAYKYEDFYNLYLRGEKYESYEEWYKEIKEDTEEYGLRPAETYISKEKKKVKLLVYTQPLLNTSDNSTLRIYIQDTVLEQLLPLMPEGGVQCITNEQGELLYCRESRETLQEVEKNQKNYFTVQHSSEKTGLTFYAVYPKDVVNSRKVSNAIILMLLILFAGTVGIGVSYWMTKKTATPISDILKEISRTMGGNEENLNSVNALQTTFTELCKNNSTLREAMEKQKPYMRNAFLNRLIYGNILSEAEGEQIADSLGFKTRDMVFAVLIFQFEMGKDFIWNQKEGLLNAYALSLMEAIKKIIPSGLYANLGEDQIILLFKVPSEEKENLRKEAEEKISGIREELPSHVAEKTVVYGGTEADSLMEIRESYNNAVFLTWNGNDKMEDGIIWYDGSGMGAPMYPPADFGGKLAYCIVAGDEKGLHDELEKVLKQYIFDNSLPVYLQHMLLNELQIVLFRTLSRIKMEEESYRDYCRVLEESRTEPLLSQFSTTLNLFRSICEYVKEQKQSQNKGLDTMIASVVSYIDANYMDSNLSLTGVADNFNVGDSALSSLFKQSMGINFSVYVENVRLEKAKILLKTTDLNIGDIAQKVGYSSANSFCRAFKRATGKNASSCREK